jgi:hypothetical protein
MDHSKKYEIQTFPMDEIVPASIYETVPDEEKIKPELAQGSMDKPLVLWPITQDYWKNIHLKFYRRSCPTLPDVAPEKDGQVLVVWKGRQRYQLAKEMGYTHIDCVIEKEQHKIVEIARQEKIK